MNKINDGGPAMPGYREVKKKVKPISAYAQAIEEHEIDALVPVQGFSKLEAYALAAMQGMLSQAVDSMYYSRVAKLSFDVAEAMLAEYELRK